MSEPIKSRRQRLAAADGDTSTTYGHNSGPNAYTRITIAPEEGVPAEQGDPGVELRMDGGGWWTLTEVYPADSTGRHGEELARGNVDRHAHPFTPELHTLEGVAAAAVHGRPAVVKGMAEARRNGWAWAECGCGQLVRRDNGQWVDADGREHSDGHTVRVDNPGVPAMTGAGVQELARAVNLAARMVPAQTRNPGPNDAADGDVSYPTVYIGGFYVAVYVDATGTLRVSIDSDGGEDGQWLHSSGGVPITKVTVNDHTVSDDSRTAQWAHVAAAIRGARLMAADDVALFTASLNGYVPDPSTTSGITKICDMLMVAYPAAFAKVSAVAAVLADVFSTPAPLAYTPATR